VSVRAGTEQWQAMGGVPAIECGALPAEVRRESTLLPVVTSDDASHTTAPPRVTPRTLRRPAWQ